MKQIVVTVLLTLFIAVPFSASAEKRPTAVEVSNDLRWAEYHLNKGNYQKAEDLLNPIFNNNREMKRTGGLLITLYRLQGKTLEERAVWSALRSANPEDDTYFRGYVEALLQSGDLKRAEQVLNDSRKRNSPELNDLRLKLTTHKQVNTTSVTLDLAQPVEKTAIVPEKLSTVAPAAPPAKSAVNREEVVKEVQPVRVSTTEPLLTLHFRSFDTELSEYEQRKLDNLVSGMTELRDENIHITGYGDILKISCRSQGTYKDNRQLSVARARSVGQYLTDRLNFNPGRIYLYGAGASKPEVENMTKAGRAYNRRAELRATTEPLEQGKAFPLALGRSERRKVKQLPDSSEILHRAEYLIGQKEYAKAEALLDPIFNQDIDMKTAGKLLIESYRTQGRLLEERSIWSGLKSAYPDDLAYLRGYIDILLRTGGIAQAAILLNSTRIKHHPDFATLRTSLSLAQSLKGAETSAPQADESKQHAVTVAPAALSPVIADATPRTVDVVKSSPTPAPVSTREESASPVIPEIVPDTMPGVLQQNAETKTPTVPPKPLPPKLFEPFEKGAFALLVNGEKRGEHFVLLKDNDIYVERDTLVAAGFNETGNDVSADGLVYTSLASRGAGLTYVLNEREFQLQITAETAQFKAQEVNLRESTPVKPDPVANKASGFINYDVDLQYDNKTERHGVNIPHEMGIRYGNLLFFSSYNFIKPMTERDKERYVRLYSNLSYDDQERMQRFTLGDFNVASSGLGGGATIGGIQLKRNFSMNPYFIKTSGLQVTGAVETSSEVEVYRNGSLITKRSLAPGYFDLQNMPLLDGSGDVTLVIKDAFGREKRIDMPYTVSQSLLRQGVHDYSYATGYVRENLGTSSTKYGTAAATIHHGYGLTPYLTVSGELEYRNSTGGIGASLTATIPYVGTIGIQGATSWSDTATTARPVNGYAYRFGLSNGFPLAGFFYSLNYSRYSREYATISMEPYSARSLEDLSGSIGVGGNDWGNVSLFGSMHDSSVSGQTTSLGARYSLPLFKWFTISASVTQNRSDSRSEVASLLSLNSYLGNNGNASITTEQRGAERSLRADIQRSVGNEEGLGYRLHSQFSDTGRPTGDAEASWHGRYGIYTAKASLLNDRELYGVRTSGSITTLFDGIQLGRPVYDSFAVIKVDSLRGVPVYQGGRIIGTTNSHGEIFANNLSSYAINPFIVKQHDLPFNYSAPQLNKTLFPQWRSGSRLLFDVNKMQALRGTISILDGDKTVPADFWVLTISNNGKEEVAPLVKDGEFYLENIPAGTYPAQIAKNKKQCGFTMVIPANDDAMIDLGTITCIMQKKKE